MSEQDMCPNCVTPWKCNGPHIPAFSASAETAPTGERESVLVEAQRLVHGDRNAAYGPPTEDFGRTAAMVNAMFAHKLREPLTAADVGMFMVCVKLSRQVNKPKRDNCVDGAGYFECIQWCLDVE